MTLAAGAQLGPYSIQEPLGQGGMGEVYRAVDTRLDRAVAIKVLPSHVTNDPGKRQRFEREARAVAAVNHPHICALFDVGSQDGVEFLVMEHLEGETLERRLIRGALPLEEVLRHAIEIAGALDHAHRHGIVHRDLKPANVMLTATGAKLLDFGLARWNEHDTVSLGGKQTRASRETETITAEGTILGTVQYMAPEQVEGKEAGARADVFAFGAIVHEMATGGKAFTGDSRAGLIAAILTADPAPITTLEPRTPLALERIVKKCLAKSPDARWQSARDLLDALTWIAEGGSPIETRSVATVGSTAATSRPVPLAHQNLLVAGASLILGAGLALAALALMRSAPAAARPVRFTVVPDADQRLLLGSADRNVAISPDGTRLVYETTGGDPTSGLQVRAVDQLQPAHLGGTGGARWPFISSDSQWIGFYVRTGGGTGEIRRISMSGGPAITVCQVQGTLWGASWGANDTIILATNDRSTGLVSVNATGGTPMVLTRPDPRKGEFDHVLPFILPGGRTVLFTIVTQRAVGGARIAALDLETGRQSELIPGGSQAEYVDTGHLVYAADGALRAVRFDPSRLSVLGSPVSVVERVLTKVNGTAAFSASSSGALVYVSGGIANRAAFDRSIVWVDREGREQAIHAPPREYVYPRVSPDGTKIALDIRDEENHIWIWNVARETMTRLTVDRVTDGSPVWTPDSARVVFHSQRSGQQALHRQLVDGEGAVEQLTKDTNPLAANSVTPDGKQLVALESTMTNGADLTLVRLDGAPRIESLIHTPFEEGNAEISPDGRWLAYESTELGQPEIFVRPFPHVNAGRWQLSTGGGRQPVWARKGRELFYVSPRERALMSVTVLTGASFSSRGNSRKILDTSPYLTSGAGRSYDVSADGRKFLMIKIPASSGPSTQTPTAMTVVLNWSEELKQRVPRR